MKRRTILFWVFATTVLPACKDTAKISMTEASAHVAFLAEAVSQDVEEVRRGLPEGADLLAISWKADPTIATDLKAAADALEATRRKVQDLRLAKSTFFAIADDKGIVLRNNQEQDRMAGKSLLLSFPGLSEAKSRYTEALGSMPEASGVRAPRADGQWIAAAPVRIDSATKGLYVTGWSWSSYAYRLEFAVRGKLRSELAAKHDLNEPLVYVFVIVDKTAYGAPVSPEVSRNAVAASDPLSRTKGEETSTFPLDITGRTYGLAVRRTPVLGQAVGIAVLRSET